MSVITAAPLLDLKGDFPGLTGDWAYLDTAATSQKPQVVIDAIARRDAAQATTTIAGQLDSARIVIARDPFAAPHTDTVNPPP